MLRYFDITGGDKKKLIETISSYLDIKPEYQGLPISNLKDVWSFSSQY